jgi:hypothetical protein
MTSRVFGFPESFMDYLLSSLRNACSQCQEQACESPLGLLAFQRLELAEARLDDLAAGSCPLCEISVPEIGEIR